MSQKTAKKERKDAPKPATVKCMFPPCTAKVTVAAPPEGVEVGTPQHMSTLGGIPMCPKHADWLNFYVWAATSIKLQAQQTKGGLVLPGNEKFNPTLGQAAGR